MSRLHHSSNGHYSKAKGCQRKQYAHDTREAAEVHKARLAAAGSYEPRLNVYLCRDKACGKWHVGHLMIRKV